MKALSLIILFIVSSFGFAQNNYIVKTEDGRRVLLKADYTWEYIDMAKTLVDSTSMKLLKPANSKDCNVADGFVEPELDNNIQMQLKRGRAAIDDVKKKVAKDFKCNVEDVLLLSASEDKNRGFYNFCANGTKVAYKRNGHTIVKRGQMF